MKFQNKRTLPPRLEAARRRFAVWRKRRKGRCRIPEPLWNRAVKVSEEFGICQTARALGVDYNALKKRAASRAARSSTAGTPFVELVPGGVSRISEGIIELEDPHGAKMRIHVKGAELPDLAALGRDFWSPKA